VQSRLTLLCGLLSGSTRPPTVSQRALFLIMRSYPERPKGKQLYAPGDEISPPRRAPLSRQDAFYPRARCTSTFGPFNQTTKWFVDATVRNRTAHRFIGRHQGERVCALGDLFSHHCYSRRPGAALWQILLMSMLIELTTLGAPYSAQRAR